MQSRMNIEFCRRLERASHFLDTQQERETGIEPARDGWFTPPVFTRKDCRCPLAGSEAVKSLTAVISQLLASSVDAAAKVASEVLAGFPGKFVMPELAATLKRKRGAAKSKALAAIGGKVGLHFDAPSFSLL